MSEKIETTTDPTLPWDIVYMIEKGAIMDAVETLAAQRHIAQVDAALLVCRYMDYHGMFVV